MKPLIVIGIIVCIIHQNLAIYLNFAHHKRFYLKNFESVHGNYDSVINSNERSDCDLDYKFEIFLSCRNLVKTVDRGM